jgi:hypothetical protein
MNPKQKVTDEEILAGEVENLKGAFESENLLGKVLGTVGLDGGELWCGS